MSLSYSNPSDPLATDEGKFLIVAAAIAHALILLDGFMTSYGIIVRQELRIVPGLMLTRPVYSVYPAYDVKIAQVGERSFRFESAPYGDRRPHADVKVVALSRIPWRGGWLAE